MKVLNQSRSHRVVKDVESRGVQVFVGAQTVVVETALPETRLVPPKSPQLIAARLPRTNDLPQGGPAADAKQKMHVVRHEAVGIDRVAKRVTQLSEELNALKTKLKISKDGHLGRSADSDREDAAALGVRFNGQANLPSPLLRHVAGEGSRATPWGCAGGKDRAGALPHCARLIR